MTGDVLLLLNHQVEVIAHEIVEAQRLDPRTRGRTLLGAKAQVYERLVEVEPHGEDSHRITVRAPEEYADYWLVFSRETSPAKLQLQEPGREAGTS